MKEKKNKEINDNNQKVSITKLLLTIAMLLVVVLGGTFAWFSYQSRKTALVLTITGENDAVMTIKPYQINDTMIPVNNYISGVFSNIKLTNSSSDIVVAKIFYKINNIDQALINNGLKYTITTSDTEDGHYTVLDTGDFTQATDELVILEREVEPNTEIYYIVYLWLDNSVGDQTLVQNSSLDVELNGEIDDLTHTVYINYHVNNGSIATASNTNGTWTTTDSLVYLNSVLLTTNIDYGMGIGSDGLNNYNNSSYLNITRDAYTPPSGAEWKCLSGCTTANKTFGQDVTTYTSDDFCDASEEDCTVILGVNWEANTYTISYNACSGTGAPSSQTKTHGTALTLSSTTPTRTGYTFKGWSTAASCSAATSVNYAAGASYTTEAPDTLYAVWEPVSYTISYDACGGSEAPGSQTKTHGTALTLSSTTPTKMGYTFKGWSTAASCSAATSVNYASGASYTAEASDTLYAVWTAGTVYLFNGGSVNASITGGWVDALDAGFSFTNTSRGLIDTAVASAYLKVQTTGAYYNSKYQSSAIVTTNKIDFSNVKTLNFNIQEIGKGSVGVAISSSKKIDGYATAWDYTSASASSISGTKSLDVSGYDGSYYVYLYALAGATNPYPLLTLNKIWLVFE